MSDGELPDNAPDWIKEANKTKLGRLAFEIDDFYHGRAYKNYTCMNMTPYQRRIEWTMDRIEKFIMEE